MRNIESSSIELVQGANTFKQGENITLGYKAYDDSGNQIDLTGKTLAASLFGQKGTVYEAPASFSDGILYFSIEDTVVPDGNYQIEFTATSSADTTYRRKFPTSSADKVFIKKSTDDLGNAGVGPITVAQLRTEQEQKQQQFELAIVPQVDELKQRVEEGIGAFTEDTELKDARMGEINLRTFNQKLTTQLDDKALKSDLQQVSLSYKESYDTLALLQTAYPTGDNYNHTVKADGMIYTYAQGTWKSTGIQANGTGIADSSVTLEKLANVRQPANRDLIVRSTVVNARQLNGTSPGGVTTFQAEDKSTTDFMEVEENASYYFSSTAGSVTYALRVNYYDSANVFLSTATNVSLIVPPANCKRVRITFFTDQLPTAVFQLGTSRTVISLPTLTGVKTEGEIQLAEDVQEISNKLAAEVEISCWGDSLTAGAGGTPYPTTLQTLIGSGVNVNNFGVGGENSKTIAARQGGMPMIVDPFTIPASGGTAITFKTYDGATVTPGLQHGFRGVNPCTINGVEGNLSVSGGVYTFTRLVSGSEVSVSRPSALITNAMKENRNDIVIIWMGQNDGVNDATEIIRLEKLMVDYLTSYNKQFLIIGLSSSDAAYRAPMEQQFKKEFGRRFINIREYLSAYGLEDAGIEPTSQDLTDMANGVAPTSLRIDLVHFNTAGYTVIANQVHKRLKELAII